MGLFKDFKEDFSQAAKELLPGDDVMENDDVVVDTLSENVDVKSELSKLDGLLEQVKEEPVKPVVEKPVVKERVVEVNVEEFCQNALYDLAIEKGVVGQAQSYSYEEKDGKYKISLYLKTTMEIGFGE